MNSTEHWANEPDLPGMDAGKRATATTAAIANPNQLSFLYAVPAIMNNAAIQDRTDVVGAATVPTPEATPANADMPADAQACDVVDTGVATEPTLGEHLRAAREALGMSCEAAANKLKLPLKVLHALETDHYDRIGYGVYLRGYLTKYLELLNLPTVLAERVVSTAAELPPLIMSGAVSRQRYLFQRYSGSALYLILTGVIVVPAVLLAMRAGMDQNVVRIAPLDPPEIGVPVAAQESKGTTGSAAIEVGHASATSSLTAAVATSNADESPLIASMAPFSAAPTSAPSVPTGDSQQHGLRLSLAAPSWVEVSAEDGRKLEYGLLPAGTVRNYSDDQPLHVRLGNATGATVEVDGKPQDLSAFRRANVVNFKLAAGELSAVHSGG